MIELIQNTTREGGVVLWILLVLAVMIYGLVADLWLSSGKVRRLVQSRDWLDAQGDSGERNARTLHRQFAQFELDDYARINRRLPFLGVLIGAAPLLGLLGTVGGMLITFGGMASASGIAPIDTVSTGISRALVTTQAGLVVAVPAAFLMAFLKRRATLIQDEALRQLHAELAAIASTR